MKKLLALFSVPVVVLALAAPVTAGNPSGATPHQYKVYCASIHGAWVSNLQTCNGVPLSVWTGVWSDAGR